jgi:hypothetical protein
MKKQTKAEIEQEYLNRVQSIKKQSKEALALALDRKKFMLADETGRSKIIIKLLDANDKQKSGQAERYFNNITHEEKLEVFSHLISKAKVIDFYIQETMYLENLSLGSIRYSIVFTFRNKIKLYLVRCLLTSPSNEVVMTHFKNHFRNSQAIKLQNTGK